MELDKKLIGHEFAPFTATVEAGKIKLFCKAIGEEDPIYSDEAAAKAAGRKVKVGRFAFRANGKAIAAGETEGFVKTLFDAETGALVGAHMIGAEVTEMIQGYALAMTLEATEAELHATVFPHPTMSEAMHESALDAYGLVLHA